MPLCSEPKCGALIRCINSSQSGLSAECCVSIGFIPCSQSGHGEGMIRQ